MSNTLTKVFSLVGLFLLNGSVKSQEMKLFNSDASLGIYDGQLSYSYYEDPKTYEYIKNGKFSFSFISGNSANFNKGMEIKITGNYLNGFKNGLWIYNITFVDFKIGDYYHTGKKTITANYINGRLNGRFLYDYSDKIREWKSTFGGGFWTPFEPLKTRKFEANFQKGKLLGKMTAVSMGINFKTDMSCNVDDSGYLHGDFTYLDRGYNNDIKIKYWHGLRISSLTREISTGEITKRFTEDTLKVNAYKYYFLTDSAEYSDLAEHGYDFSEANSFGVYGDDMGYSMNQIFNDEDFCFKELTGDLSIGNDREGIIYGYYVSLEPHKVMFENYYWKEYLKALEAKDYNLAIGYLEKVKNDSYQTLSNTELILWQQKLEECKQFLK